MSKKPHRNNDTLYTIDILQGVSSMFDFFQLLVFVEYTLQVYFLEQSHPNLKFAYKYHMKTCHIEMLTLFVIPLIDHTGPNSKHVKNILSLELY